ncbi:MAG: Lrp/AsnC family transcriptional regulator [Lentisphaeria bacterium]|nr:Lrp/AsnC family transcriptional regulator [Lentisphaeria bacterium]MBO5766530.1 Lrp/AsnC family transcriptional regulator [Lentisphaeria bacterium]MBO5899891.1 Lrp/AsnC family transcriptional regulator [Lentisphaeria bacterium]
MKNFVLNALRENARISAAEIAELGNFETSAVEKTIKELEDSHIIRGYTAICDGSVDDGKVKAVIEVKVTPNRDGGFDQVAQRIARYPEVSDLCLISGSFDLLITINGKSLNEVANFVASKLATIDGVQSTSTGFMLKKYKESGRIMEDFEDYERLKVTP